MNNDASNSLNVLGLASHGLPAMIFVLLSVTNVSMANTTSVEIGSEGSSIDRSDFLQGKRLFFDSHERAGRQSTQHPLDDKAVNRELSDSQSTAESPDDGLNAAAGPVVPLSSRKRLRYEAYIGSVDSISIIVNGRSCRRLVHDVGKLASSTERMLDCPSLDDENLILLLDGTKSLKVMRGGSLIGILLPGQSL